jgi:hypothetical protein
VSGVLRRLGAATAGVLLAACLAGAGPLGAQDTTGVRRDSVPAPDSAAVDTVLADPVPADTAPADAARAAGLPADTVTRRRHPSPTGAFLRSLVLPGWGQAALGRKLPAGLFLALEGVTLGMALKTDAEVRQLRRTGSVLAEQKAKSREDWFVFLVANHLLAGLEAFVSGHMVDFPEDLDLRIAPGERGGVVGRVTLPLDLR